MAGQYNTFYLLDPTQELGTAKNLGRLRFAELPRIGEKIIINNKGVYIVREILFAPDYNGDYVPTLYLLPCDQQR